ncbi:hypothetical protein GALL_488590 [mine drainage metagenome]|uniref:Uncharacterized protein n=1 Tax=mine drainage metagenome TaxID=410659 RepID=A0A1J5PE80_9ZZZZ
MAWGAGGEGSGMTEQAFAAQFAKYKILQAQVGAPGEPEGGAGSIYIQAPVQIQGQLANGAPFHQGGVVTLRRVIDVPGATADQLRWRISQVDLHPNP